MKNKEGIMDLAGAWSDISDEDIKGIKKIIAKSRKGNRMREIIGKM